MASYKCNECSFVTKRFDNLKRHVLNVHNSNKNIIVKETRHIGDGLPRAKPEPEDNLYTKEEYEQIMSSIRARFPNREFSTL